MSNKGIGSLNSIDRDLRRAYPVGMRDGVDCVIRKITGFEKFNTRPYHNYETWSDGYEACDGVVFASGEDLDECVAALLEARRKHDSGERAQKLSSGVLSSFGFKVPEDAGAKP
jgi:hypothetical protein